MNKTQPQANWTPVIFNRVFSHRLVDPILVKYPDRLRELLKDEIPMRVEMIDRTRESCGATFSGWMDWRKGAAQVTTAAQFAVTFGGLQARAKCIDLDDLLQSVSLAEDGNEFVCERVQAAFAKHHLHAYYSPNNPNNGGDLYTYFIGREYSPVVYVCAPIGAHYLNANWTKYSDNPLGIDEFKSRMGALGRSLRADESFFDGDFVTHMFWRFWWD